MSVSPSARASSAPGVVRPRTGRLHWRHACYTPLSRADSRGPVPSIKPIRRTDCGRSSSARGLASEGQPARTHVSRVEFQAQGEDDRGEPGLPAASEVPVGATGFGPRRPPLPTRGAVTAPFPTMAKVGGDGVQGGKSSESRQRPTVIGWRRSGPASGCSRGPPRHPTSVRVLDMIRTVASTRRPGGGRAPRFGRRTPRSSARAVQGAPAAPRR
jgi:hypothetical protein